MRRPAVAELLFLLGFLLAGEGCSSPPRASSSRATVEGWYVHPDPRFVAVRILTGEFLFLGKYDVERRRAVEHPDGVCFIDPARPESARAEIHTRAEVDDRGDVILVERKPMGGRCAPADLVTTRTRLVAIRDQSRIDTLEAALRPFSDPASCGRYERCCQDRTRPGWDASCGTRRNIPAQCWSLFLVMNEERACP